jgi:hypothetical protein
MSLLDLATCDITPGTTDASNIAIRQSVASKRGSGDEIKF